MTPPSIVRTARHMIKHHPKQHYAPLLSQESIITFTEEHQNGRVTTSKRRTVALAHQRSEKRRNASRESELENLDPFAKSRDDEFDAEHQSWMTFMTMLLAVTIEYQMIINKKSQRSHISRNSRIRNTPRHTKTEAVQRKAMVLTAITLIFTSKATKTTLVATLFTYTFTSCGLKITAWHKRWNAKRQPQSKTLWLPWHQSQACGCCKVKELKGHWRQPLCTLCAKAIIMYPWLYPREQQYMLKRKLQWRHTSNTVSGTTEGSTTCLSYAFH